MCFDHKSENAAQLKKFKEELKNKKLHFTFLCNMDPLGSLSIGIVDPFSAVEDLVESLPIISNNGKQVKYRVVEDIRNAVGKRKSMPYNEIISNLKKLTPAGETLISKPKDPPL